MKNKITLLLALLLCCCSYKAGAQIITTVAGDSLQGYCCDGMPAMDAELDNPYSLAVDAANNVYIADRNNNRIRKVNSSGIITTVAGTGVAGYTGDGSLAALAEINYPIGIAIDGLGNFCFTDRYNNSVRKVSSSGIISTVAGNGSMGFGGDGGAATSAELNAPGGIAIDEAGNIYICDGYNNRVRKINTSGIISTIAGTATGGFSGDGGMATDAELNQPYGIALDRYGNIYISEWTNRIRKINASGVITSIAGNGSMGLSGDGGAATLAEFNNPTGIAIDGNGNVFIADAGNSCIRWINASGIINSFAGTGIVGFSGDGGLAIDAELTAPTGVTIDSKGDFYIADLGNNRIRYVKNTLAVKPLLQRSINVDIYPNPSDGVFNINVVSDNNESLQISISDVVGRMVNEFDITTNQPLNVALDEPSGVYFLTARTADGVVGKKIEVIR